MFFICVHTCSSKEKKEKRERRNFTIPLDSKSHYKFTGINTSIFLADISWILNPNPSFLPPPSLHPSSHFPFSPFHPSPFPIHIPMLNNISLFTHFLSFVSSASPLYFFFHPTLLSFFLFFLFFFYLISIHPIEYNFLHFFHSNHFYFYTRSLHVPFSTVLVSTWPLISR